VHELELVCIPLLKQAEGGAIVRLLFLLRTLLTEGDEIQNTLTLHNRSPATIRNQTL
jgi:hypothetical protein